LACDDSVPHRRIKILCRDVLTPSDNVFPSRFKPKSEFSSLPTTSPASALSRNAADA